MLSLRANHTLHCANKLGSTSCKTTKAKEEEEEKERKKENKETKIWGEGIKGMGKKGGKERVGRRRRGGCWYLICSAVHVITRLLRDKFEDVTIEIIQIK